MESRPTFFEGWNIIRDVSKGHMNIDLWMLGISMIFPKLVEIMIVPCVEEFIPVPQAEIVPREQNLALKKTRDLLSSKKRSP